MRVAVESLNRYLDKPLSTEQMVTALLRTEIEVEEVISSAPWDDAIVVGEVKTVAKHPNADRLQLVTVDVGRRQRLQIVCGAPNIAAGMRVAVALVGAALPDGHVIKRADIRGLVSHGMICSEAELGISDDHSGVLVLDHSTPIGKKLCDVWPKTDVLDIKTPSNRWDHLSWLGIAREIAVFGPQPNSLKNPEISEKQHDKIEVENVKKTGQCQRFITVKLRVKNNVRTPRWIVDNLEANGLRSISPVVDISNLVMLEFGQPSHPYDAAKVHGTLQVRHGSPADRLTTIDGAERTLSRQDLVIADGQRVLGLAGVMGGRDSEVTAQTKEIILEVAVFDATTVRRMALRHGLRSEASVRFERGLPLPLPQLAADRLVDLLADVCEAELLDSPTDQLYQPIQTRQIGLRLHRAERLLGLELDEAFVVTGLRRLGLAVEHFSLSREAERQLGKPFALQPSGQAGDGSRFNGPSLISYLYGRLGTWVGDTVADQWRSGTAVEGSLLRAGDVLFVGRPGSKRTAAKPSQVGFYVGKNKVLEAVSHKYNLKSRRLEKLPAAAVRLSPLADYLNHPAYLGARRYVANFNHILAITVPWWRTDLNREEDIVEEIIKLIGYDSLQSTLPQLPPQPTGRHQLLPDILLLKQQLAATGWFEIMSYSFIGRDDLGRVGLPLSRHLSVANPLSSEQAYLRSNLLPSFLNVLDKNSRYATEMGWFEISKVHRRIDRALPVEEQWQLGIMAVGTNSLRRLRGWLDWLAQRQGMALTVRPVEHNWFIDGRAAKLNLDGRLAGRFGQLKPALVGKNAAESEVSYAEIAIEPMLSKTKPRRAQPVLAYQSVSRDMSLELDLALPWAQVAGLLAAAPRLLRYALVDDYRGKQVPRGKKIITVRLVFDLGAQPSAAAIDAHYQTVAQILQRRLQATIR